MKTIARMFTKTNKGFTLVEIMIVVAIIGLLIAIALPNFLEARKKSQRNTCRANLKQIDGATQIVLLESNCTVTMDTLVTAFIKSTPLCPSRSVPTAQYGVSSDGTTAPTCPSVGTYSDHVLTL